MKSGSPPSAIPRGKSKPMQIGDESESRPDRKSALRYSKDVLARYTSESDKREPLPNEEQPPDRCRLNDSG